MYSLLLSDCLLVCLFVGCVCLFVVLVIVVVIVNVSVDAFSHVETSIRRRLVNVVLLEPLRHATRSRLLRNSRVRRLNTFFRLFGFAGSGIFQSFLFLGNFTSIILGKI